MCGSLSPLATNVAFVKDLPYDPRRNLTPIGGATLTNHVLLVRSDSPIRSFADFIAAAKQRPGKLSVGASTSIVQLQIASMNRMAGIDLLVVPYKGTPATITDVIGGVLDATLTDPGNALAQVKGGRLRPLAVTSLKRNPATPDWPAISETLPGFDFPSWNAVVGPAGMSRELVDRISAALIESQKQPEVADFLKSQGTVPLIMGPDQLRGYMVSEVDKYVRLAREANIQPE
jgi:tripartite-type tricarboxylate transporter receptor subunit TctC